MNKVNNILQILVNIKKNYDFSICGICLLNMQHVHSSELYNKIKGCFRLKFFVKNTVKKKLRQVRIGRYAVHLLSNSYYVQITYRHSNYS